METSTYRAIDIERALPFARTVKAPTVLSGRRVDKTARELALDAQTGGHLVLDLRPTRRIDVAGLVLILKTHKARKTANSELILLCSDGPVLELLERLGIHRAISILSDESEIRRSIDLPNPTLHLRIA